MADFTGTDASEVVNGSSGDDTIYSSKGQDILNGAEGYDKAVVDYRNAGSSGDSFGQNIFYQYDSLYGIFRGSNGYMMTETVRIEHIEFLGSVGSDQFYVDLSNDPGNWRVSLDAGGGSGFDSIRLIWGGGPLVGNAATGTIGTDRITLKGFEQFYLTLTGNHDDNLTLAAGYDVIKAGRGNDRIDGGAGNDTIDGDEGNDHLLGGDGNDILFAESSTGTSDEQAIDILEGGAGDDSIAIGYGDSADGGSGTDILSITLRGGTSGANLDLAAVFAGGSITVGGGTIRGFESYGSIRGSSFDDIITTGDAPIASSGANGSAGVFGNEGNDTITTGNRVDRVNGGDGNDTLRLGASADYGYGELGNDVIYGEAGDDTLSGAGGDDTIYGGADNDIIRGELGFDRLYGEGGNDILLSRGDGYPPTSEGGILDGGDGNDLLHAGANDTITGGSGIDVLFLDLSLGESGVLVDLRAAFSGGNGVNGAGTVSGIEQYGSITGTAFADTIFVGNGTAYSDPNSPGALVGLYGGAGDDMIVGGISGDYLDGGTGGDRLVGGAGDDKYIVDSINDLVFEDANGGIDLVTYTGATGGYYLHANVENGSLGEFVGTNTFMVGNDLANTLTGSYGANLLLGGGGDDTIRAGYGNDTVYGQDGADQILGGVGIDFLVGGAGNDVIDGENDADALYGEDGDDTLTGGVGFVTDILVGGNGNDILHGSTGQGDYDRMDGGAGDDIYYVDTGDDLTFEAAGGGTDTVYASVAGDNNGVYLYANVENLVLLNATRFGVGNELANVMTGSASGNWLLGGAGNDVLNGKGGNDVLFGEGGSDRFVFERGTGGDVIGDFQTGADKIDLSAFGFTWQTVINSMHENAGTTAIDLGNGDLIVLNGVTKASLNQSDFILTPAKVSDQLSIAPVETQQWSPVMSQGGAALTDRYLGPDGIHTNNGLGWVDVFL